MKEKLILIFFAFFVAFTTQYGLKEIENMEIISFAHAGDGKCYSSFENNQYTHDKELNKAYNKGYKIVAANMAIYDTEAQPHFYFVAC
ncbi:hypothetical protein D5085_09055 [Ectothiorhodospiraceae bacterium BW-2]|nr:hypothetical protein D5085_09055 [Ectothiorhodospiraceae bacterium BW-2]